MKQWIIAISHCRDPIQSCPAYIHQTIQNNCLRICKNMSDPRDADIHEMHTESGLEKLQPRRARQLLSWMFGLSKDESNTVPPVRVLRDNDNVRLKVSRHHKDIYLKSPLHRGARYWSRLTADQQRTRLKPSFMASLSARDLVPLAPLVV